MTQARRTTHDPRHSSLRLLFPFLFFFLFFAGPTNAANMEAVLDSANGSSGLSLQDSSSTEIFHTDSDGNVVTKGVP